METADTTQLKMALRGTAASAEEARLQAEQFALSSEDAALRALFLEISYLASILRDNSIRAASLPEDAEMNALLQENAKIPALIQKNTQIAKELMAELQEEKELEAYFDTLEDPAPAKTDGQVLKEGLLIIISTSLLGLVAFFWGFEVLFFIGFFFLGFAVLVFLLKFLNGIFFPKNYD